jgi:RHS repeat-associated protein
VLRYAGEYWDDTTGLQYLRARWYDPGTARFMGEDTYQGEINEPLSLNGYTYVHNNPLTNSDPTGNWCTATVRGKYYSHPGYCSGSGKNADYIPDSISINFGRSIYAAGVKQGTWYPKGATRVKWDKSGISDAVMGCYYDVQCASFVSGSLVEGPAVAKITKGKSASTGKTVKDVISKCNCFTAGTKVQTDEGEKPIEDIEVGDKVLAKDDETGEMAYKEVEWLFQRDVEEIYNITVGGEVITTTDEHPFWIVGKGWVKSKDVLVGDILTTSNGKELAIEKIEVKKEHATVYNFMVKDYHTYFVSNLGIWTHNSCLPDSRWIQRDTYKELKRLGLNEQFDRAMKKGLAITRSNDNGIIFLSKSEQLMQKGNLYTYKLKVAKASNHVRVYGRIDNNGNLLFDYITSGK